MWFYVFWRKLDVTILIFAIYCVYCKIDQNQSESIKIRLKLSKIDQNWQKSIYRGCAIASPPDSDLRVCRYGVLLFLERPAVKFVCILLPNKTLHVNNPPFFKKIFWLSKTFTRSANKNLIGILWGVWGAEPPRKIFVILGAFSMIFHQKI